MLNKNVFSFLSIIRSLPLVSRCRANHIYALSISTDSTKLRKHKTTKVSKQDSFKDLFANIQDDSISIQPSKLLTFLEKTKEEIKAKNMSSAVHALFLFSKRHQLHKNFRTKLLLEFFKIAKPNIRDLQPSEALDILEGFFKLSRTYFKSKESIQVVEPFLAEISKGYDCLSLQDFNRLMFILEDIESDSKNFKKFKNLMEEKVLSRLVTDFDKNDYNFLINAIRYSRNMHNKKLFLLLKKILETKVKSSDISLAQVIGIVVTLCTTDYFIDCSDLYQESIKIISKNVHNLTKDEIQFLLRKIRLKNTGLNNYFYCEELIDKLVDQIIKEDVGLDLGLQCLSSLNEMRHINKRLLNYLSAKYYEMITISQVNVLHDLVKLFALFEGLAFAAHKPPFIKELLNSITNPKILERDLKELIYVAWHMACLDYHDHKILERVFEQNDDVEDHLPSLWMVCKIWQYTVTLPNYDGPLPSEEQIQSFKMLRNLRQRSYAHFNEVMQCVGGSEFVLTNVMSNLFHHIDYVIAIKSDGTLFKINPKLKGSKNTHLFFDRINVPGNCIKVAILCSDKDWHSRNGKSLLGTYSMYYRTLNAIEKHLIFINVFNWESMSASGRQEYLQQEIDKIAKKYW